MAGIFDDGEERQQQQQQHEQQDPLYELCGLWKTKGGHLGGNLGGLRVIVMKNTRKGSDNAPDARILVTRRQFNKDNQQGGGGGEPPPF